MPSPPFSLPMSLSDGDVPFRSEADVLALLPGRYRQQETAPTRDAVVAALTAIAREYQDDATYAAAQSDYGTAEDIYQDAQLGDRGFARGDGEGDAPYLVRASAGQAVVTPEAILAVANAALAPYSAIKAAYYEPGLDTMFLGAGNNDRYFSTLGSSPYFPDRFYPSDEVSNGVFIVGREAGAARLDDDDYGREFVLRLPPLDPDGDGTFVGDGAVYLADFSNTAFLFDSANDFDAFLNSTSATALGIYQGIANSITRIVGASVRWILLEDPLLV